ncbi:MAG TPA: heavy metal translocating P-type ATPase [Gemmatimonadales bacterium]|nr:heavy metal translocating P-type ATPase [Gemmatimonadales bacterium]
MRLPAGALLALLGGLALRLGGASGAADLVWTLGLLVIGLPVVWRTLRGVLAGRFAADLVAMLAIVTALLLRQPLAGLVVVLMQTGGEALERYAEGRASQAVRELEAAAPRQAHRLVDGTVEDVPVDAVRIGDLLLVRPGELVPCDAEVRSGRSQVDVAGLTGEPLPLEAVAGVRLSSGARNLDGPLTVVVLAPARESQYERIVELVRTAQASKSPLQRLADRYAVWFTPLTLLTCLATYLLSGDMLRVLAVLVVATPCPLILATPVAIVGGINRAARHGVIVRHGGALEQLAGVTAAVFDKTGTLTIGRPEVAAVRPAEGFTSDTVLRLAGAVEQGSGHLLARTLVEAASRRGLLPPPATEVSEAPGEGVTGLAEGRRVSVGGRRYVAKQAPDAAPALAALAGGDAVILRAYVAVDGQAGGVVEYADQLRPHLPELFAALRRLGLRRVLLLSGDDQVNASAVAQAVGIVEAHGGLLPTQKVEWVKRLTDEGYRVLMVGDGTNDAPALSQAAVGVALAAGGAGITAEAADVVLLADDPGRVVEAITISRRTLRLARQSIWAGLGLSGMAMVVAALGYIPPTIGALLQEGIDVAVILNALRAALPTRSAGPTG